MQWAFISLQLLSFGTFEEKISVVYLKNNYRYEIRESKSILHTSRAHRQLTLWDSGNTLKVIVARLAEVCGSEAEEYRHRTAVTTFIFEKVCPVFRAHLCPCHVATTAAYQFSRVERFPA